MHETHKMKPDREFFYKEARKPGGCGMTSWLPGFLVKFFPALVVRGSS
jgi:hypothetical protein